MMQQDVIETTAPVRVPFRMVLTSIVGLWLCYFVLATARAELLALGFTQELLWRRAVVAVVGVGVTLGMWLILRLFDERPLWARVTAALLVALPFALVLAQANQLVFSDMSDKIMQRMAEQQGVKIRRDESGNLLVDVPIPGVPDVSSNRDAGNVGRDGAGGGSPAPITINGPDKNYTTIQQITEIALGRYFLMLAWSALYLALVAGEQARAAERREGAFRRAAKAAELRSLRYQVNPHFLFNTLNSLSALVLTGKAQRAEEMIHSMSNFYRRSLADEPTADVSLAQEFDLQHKYLDIEAVRFPDRLRTKYDLPATLEDAKVPGMILQPLVENSVKHAVAPSSGKVTITLSARQAGTMLIITVSDDGKISNPDHGTSIRQQGHGIGLVNVRERLMARFGDRASIQSGKTQTGYSTQIEIPLVR